MSGGRALFYREHIGSNQFQLRIRDNMPGEGKQWFVFNRRTRTIRSAEKRSFVVANRLGYGYRVGQSAVIRPFRGEIYQKIAYYGGKYRNIRNNAQKCLDVHGGRNTNQRHVIFWNCHNGANQGWFLDRNGVRYPRQPYRDGVKFQIRSRLPKKRALAVNRHIGRGDYDLIIQDNNSWNINQWFTFDRRSRTIRTVADRRKAVSGRIGYGFRHSQYAVARYYRNQSNQKIAFYGGHYRNVRNNARQCLMVNSSRDAHRAATVWYRCSNTRAQRWWLDPKAIHVPRYPLKDATRFQIKSLMRYNRALFTAEHIGGRQYRLRIQNNNPSDRRQWWSFDARTKTIRQYYRRSFALSNQRGYKYRINVAAVSRQYVAEVYQRMRWIDKPRRTIQMIRGKCLDVHGGRNTHRRHVIFWNCHNGANQGWKIDQKGWTYPRQPLGDGVKFQIKSQMKTNRALFWKEHIGGNQFRLRIRDNNPENNRQWFVFNRRTRTIRAYARRSHAISNQSGSRFIRGRAAVVRPFRKEVYQHIAFYKGSRRNLRNNAQMCLDVYGRSNTNNRHTTFWNCHNGLNQAWYIDTKGVRYNRYPERDGVLFQIRTRMRSKRVLVVAEHIGG